MGIFNRIKAFLSGNVRGGADWSGQESESGTNQTASTEWLESERFAQERDAMLAWNRANPALSVEESERFAQEGDPLVAALRRKPERYVEGQEEWRGDPTWEEVELYLEKTLINKREFVILNLSYPNIPFIQAVRASNLDTDATMLLQVRVCDEQIKDEGVVLLEKVVDADTCREAFRLYYESGEVADLDEYTLAQ